MHWRLGWTGDPSLVMPGSLPVPDAEDGLPVGPRLLGFMHRDAYLFAAAAMLPPFGDR